MTDRRVRVVLVAITTIMVISITAMIARSTAPQPPASQPQQVIVIQATNTPDPTYTPTPYVVPPTATPTPTALDTIYGRGPTNYGTFTIGSDWTLWVWCITYHSTEQATVWMMGEAVYQCDGTYRSDDTVYGPGTYTLAVSIPTDNDQSGNNWGSWTVVAMSAP